MKRRMMIAKEINKHMPNVEMFRMLGSGTESVMAALRIARIATGHKRIIKIGGAYHGWSDQMVYGLKIPGSRALLESHGIPSGAYKRTDEVRPNDLYMLEKMLKRNRMKGGTAAVIVEPVAPESGTRPVAHDYNKGVRELCDRYGALMIFDEVVTGFRVALSGAQGYFDIVPDLTIFGKIVAGGYPAAGGVGGKREYAELMAAGLATGKHRAYVGGTLAANPLSCLAGYTAIQEIEKTNACEVAGKMERPALRRTETADREVQSAVCCVQSGIHRASRMHRRHELRLFIHVFREVGAGTSRKQGYDVCKEGFHGKDGRCIHG